MPFLDALGSECTACAVLVRAKNSRPSLLLTWTWCEGLASTSASDALPRPKTATMTLELPAARC